MSIVVVQYRLRMKQVLSFFFIELIDLNSKRKKERKKEENVKIVTSTSIIAFTHFLFEHINNYILILLEIFLKNNFSRQGNWYCLI
jgi:hypothetical protein